MLGLHYQWLYGNFTKIHTLRVLGWNLILIRITQTTTWFQRWEPFRLLANCFPLFCIDLAVLIYPPFLADIQRPNWKSAQGSYPVDIQFLLTPALLLFYFKIQLDSLKNFYNYELQVIKSKRQQTCAETVRCFQCMK